jgi:hypothetical protein
MTQKESNGWKNMSKKERRFKNSSETNTIGTISV